MRKTYLLTLLVTLLFCYTSSAQTAKTVDVAQPGTLSVTVRFFTVLSSSPSVTDKDRKSVV